MIRKIGSVLAFLLTFPVCVISNNVGTFEGMGYQRNYSPSDYQGHPQNWSVLQDNSGRVYFANNYGVLSFDGSEWETIPIPGNMSARSLALGNDGLLYVAAKNDFGFIALDSLGKRCYFSLKHLIADSLLMNLDMRQVLIRGNEVYYRSNEMLIRYSDNKLKIWLPEKTFHRNYVVEDNFYMMLPGLGLATMKNDRLVVSSGGALFKDFFIYAILPYNNHQYLIGTKENGLFLVEKKWFDPDWKGQVALNRFVTTDDAFFKKNNIYYGLNLHDGNFVFGTYYGGLAVIDPDGKVIERHNTSNGLMNDAVWAMCEDYYGNLWCCLNNGISYVERNPSVYHWGEGQGLKGILQSIVVHQNKLFVVSSNGLFYQDHEIFKLFDDYENFAWDLIKVKEQGEDLLMLASSNGVFIVKNSSLIPLVTGVQVLKFEQHPVNPDIIYCAMIDGVLLLEKENGKWVSKGRIPEVKGEIRSLTFDKDGKLWLGVFLEGIYCLEFEEGSFLEPNKITKYTKNDGLPSHTGISVNFAGGKPVFSAESGLYIFNESKKRFEPWMVFDGGNREGFTVMPFFEDTEGDILFFERKPGLFSRKLRKYKHLDDGTYQKENIYARYPDMAVYGLAEAEDGWLWVLGSDGLFKVNIEYRPLRKKPMPVILKKVVIGSDSVVHHGFFKNEPFYVSGQRAYSWSAFQSYNSIQKFLFNDNAISFHFTSPVVIGKTQYQYSYWLDGFESKWSAWTSEGKKDYTNLPSGSYVFRVKTMDALGYESEEVSYAFIITTPWYFKTIAFVFYGLGLIALIWLMIFITGRRLKYKNMVLQRLINERTHEVIKQSEEIQEKNEELQQQKEEILIQSAELEKINQTLETRIEDAIQKSREKDMMLIQQSRLAAMGEMIGNIAHQWRQPLNAVGIIIQNINDAYKCGEINEKYLETKVEKSMEIIQYMSQTIDDFRNFFKPEKQMLLFDVKATVQKTISFIEPTLKNNNIKLDCLLDDDIHVMGYGNEYAQVVLNLLNNAKDAVIERGVLSPTIQVSLTRENQKSVLLIQDNGGGISSEYMEKIFTPYFSTKNPGQGTGIGLYMSKTIIEKNMNGMLTFKNTEKGACFSIIV